MSQSFTGSARAFVCACICVCAVLQGVAQTVVTVGPTTGTIVQNKGGNNQVPWDIGTAVTDLATSGDLTAANVTLPTLINLELRRNSKWMLVGGFGFSIPTGATVTNITAHVERYATSGFSNPVQWSRVQLAQNTTLIGNYETLPNWPVGGSGGIESATSNNALWGSALTITDINSPDFKVGIKARIRNNQEAVLFVDYFALSITYEEENNPPCTITLSPSIFTLCEDEPVQLDISGGNLTSFSPFLASSCTGCADPIVAQMGLGQTVYTVHGQNPAGEECLPASLTITTVNDDCDLEDVQPEPGASWNNYGAYVRIETDPILNVHGSLYNFDQQGVTTTSGHYENLGTIRVSEYWTNNSATGVFETAEGKVELIGVDQVIRGTAATRFNNLTLLEPGKKSQYVDAEVRGTLDLQDAELAVRDQTMHISNPATTSVIRGNGHVTSDEAYGWLERDMNTSASYLFPFAAFDANGTTRYRPIALTPASSGPDAFRSRLVWANATTGGFSNTAGNVQLVNPKFYHVLEQTTQASGADLEAIDVHFNLAEDGTFTALGDYSSGSWANAQQLSMNHVASPALSTIGTAAHPNPLNTANRIALMMAGFTINTSNFGNGTGTVYTITDPTLTTGPTQTGGGTKTEIPTQLPDDGDTDIYVINVEGTDTSTPTNISIEVDNNLTVSNVTVGTSAGNLPLSTNLYNITSTGIELLSAPDEPGPDCDNLFTVQLIDGIYLNQGDNFIMTGASTIANDIYINLTNTATDVTYQVSAANGNDLETQGVELVAGAHPSGPYNFEVVLPNSTLKGKFILK